MPVTTYVSQSEAAAARSVPGDKECDDLLGEIRRLTGEDWIVRTYPRGKPWTIWHYFMLSPEVEIWRAYEILVDVGGEWQIINLVTENNSGSVFFESKSSREHVMNFMLGYISGMTMQKRRAEAAT